MAEDNRQGGPIFVMHIAVRGCTIDAAEALHANATICTFCLSNFVDWCQNLKENNG